MTQPDALKKNEPLKWSTGSGTDVWAMFCACIAGNLEAVKQLLEKNPALVRCHYNYRKPLYFAGVRTNKNYVSFHLLYMYYNPAAQKALSPALKKRMQGKACFNFTAVDEDCFAELGRLIGDGLKIYKSEKFQQTIKDMQ